jgi:thymidylate synthase (FAD)
MSNVKLVWVTPDAEKLIAYMARVSNPKNQYNENISGLLSYCIKNQHWSIFEMVNACFEINTTRDIARQILRHKSFAFQEFSQRYADVAELPIAELREARMQDTKNRQNSTPTDDAAIASWWTVAQIEVDSLAKDYYQKALAKGIAKEQARALLPEGITPSRMYMQGTLRSWIHYVQLRSANGTQKEHMEIAHACADIIAKIFPLVKEL